MATRPYIDVHGRAGHRRTAAEPAEYQLRDMIIDTDLRLYKMFQAGGTPSAVLITADRKIGS